MFFDNEPIGKNHPFVKMDNVVIAPHIGSSTLETRKKMAELTVKWSYQCVVLSQHYPS